MANPRQERLQNDYNRLQSLVARSPYVKILSVHGTPPTEYVLKFTCKGVERLENGNPIYREDHRVKITLGPNYPNSAPGLSWQTPVFHPNIASTGNVCIGVTGGGWAIARGLDELVVYLMQMVRYEGEGLTYSADAYNRSAYQWAQNNRRLLPVDKRKMFEENWSGSIVIRSETSLPINVRGQDDNGLNIRVSPKN